MLFGSRGELWANVDFFSGILQKAIGFSINEFPQNFAIGRMPGWLTQAKEIIIQDAKIVRPRQVYVGPGLRAVPKIDVRGAVEELKFR